VVLSRHEIPVYKVNHLKIPREMQRPELNYRAIEALIRQEVSLATKLLRYVNSALFGWTQPVQSIIHALTAMGEAEIRVWVSLAALPSLTVDKPDELMRTALVRARFCEVLAPHVELGHRRPDLFLMGLFSLLDAMLDRPLNETLAELRLSGEIARVLLGKATAGDRFAGVYTLIREYETGQWDALAETAGRMGIAADIIPELYLDAVAWAEQILQY
jgi:EAL and modified HD-GYP domain-containing signal transduction protein